MKVSLNTIDNFFRELMKHCTEHNRQLRCKWCYKHALADVTEFDNSNDFVLAFIHTLSGSYYQLQSNGGNILLQKIDGPYSVSYNTEEDLYSLVIAGSEIVLTFFEKDYNFVPQKKEEQEDRTALILDKLEKVDDKLDDILASIYRMIEGKNNAPVNLPYREYPWQRVNNPHQNPFQTYCSNSSSTNR